MMQHSRHRSSGTAPLTCTTELWRCATTLPFAATPTVKTMDAGLTASPNTVAALNATLASGMAALEQFSTNWTSNNTTLPALQSTGMCPSGAHFRAGRKGCHHRPVRKPLASSPKYGVLYCSMLASHTSRFTALDSICLTVLVSPAIQLPV